ncbi:MAG: general secretion pathway protein GspB [Pseudomonadota bacterium]
MSLILDALRKSEAARRRSETPDLFSSMPQATESTRALAGWPLWAFGAAGALALLAALWLIAGRGPETAPNDPAAVVDASSASPPVATNAPPPADASLSPPPPMPGPAPMTTSPIPPPTPSANIGPASSANPPTPAPAIATTPTTAPTPRPVAPPPPTPAVDSPPAAAALPSPPPATGRIASLAELDPETRKQLPPLKLSMHLWNDAAEQRFVILDGQRLKEGDVLGELVVERITRDGVVLVWRGARLRLDR